MATDRRYGGARTASRSPVLPRSVDRALAGLVDHLSDSSSNDGRHIDRLQVRVDTQILDNAVTVNASYGLRD